MTNLFSYKGFVNASNLTHFSTVLGSFLNKPLGLLFFFIICFLFENRDFSLLSEIQDLTLLSSFVPVKIYHNADTEKSLILSDNKGKAGIYMWTHKETGKFYIGSAVDLSKRLSTYYSPLWLKSTDNYISRALILHTFSAFSLSIIEIIDITNLSKEDSRKLILSREQNYLDFIFSVDEPNIYNILKEAGSLLGYKHSDSSIAKMKESKGGENNPMLGKTHSQETKAKMRKPKSVSTKMKMSESQKNINRAGKNNPMSKKVLVYSFDSDTKVTILYKTFDSCTEAAKFFDSSSRVISYYLDKNKLYKKEWILLSSLVRDNSKE